MDEPDEKIDVGGIGNIYGGLCIGKKDGKYYWSIEECFSDDWEEIPKSLYDELIKEAQQRPKFSPTQLSKT